MCLNRGQECTCGESDSLPKISIEKWNIEHGLPEIARCMDCKLLYRCCQNSVRVYYTVRGYTCKNWVMRETEISEEERKFHNTYYLYNEQETHDEKCRKFNREIEEKVRLFKGTISVINTTAKKEGKDHGSKND